MSGGKTGMTFFDWFCEENEKKKQKWMMMKQLKMIKNNMKIMKKKNLIDRAENLGYSSLTKEKDSFVMKKSGHLWTCFN